MANVRGLLVLGLVCFLVFQHHHHLHHHDHDILVIKKVYKESRKGRCCFLPLRRMRLLVHHDELRQITRRRRHETRLRATEEYMKAPCTSYDHTTYSFY
ncbi:hypothetical protein LSAT2_027430 [Lamellibrachia satsuma]|nr:hypothetical protein LSAT2_027430 [Lamellibrachia satsuma]